jgi:hypothetical protein
MPQSAQAKANRAAYGRAWYRAHKGYNTERNKIWRAKNREKINAAEKARRAGSGRPAYLAYRKKWRAADIGGSAYDGLRRRAKGSPHATLSELRELWDRHAGFCGLTGARIPEGVRPHLDHIVSCAAGGAHTIENLRWVHPMANRAKGGHSDAEFLLWWNSRGA